VPEPPSALGARAGLRPGDDGGDHDGGDRRPVTPVAAITGYPKKLYRDCW
jgi:hypothetical protein